MPYTIEDLTAQRDSVMDQIQDMIDEPKLTYVSGSESFDWNAYHQLLMDKVDWLTEQIERLEGPAEEITEGLI